MVAVSSVYTYAHKYLKTDEMKKEFAAFERKYGFSCFEQTQALVNMAINGKALTDPKLFDDLKEYYNDVDPAFKNIVDKCLDVLIKKYEKENIQFKDGRVVDGGKYLKAAKHNLSVQKTKEDDLTL